MKSSMASPGKNHRTMAAALQSPNTGKDKHTYDPRQVGKFGILVGDAEDVLGRFPDNSVNCTITSPPYWGQRNYGMTEAIGLEPIFGLYLERLMRVFDQVHRVTTNDGSLWLNMGDRYVNKELVGMPWRVAFALKDRGWILRQDIIWDKMTMTQSAKDRLRTIHEYVFHFVKRQKYYYDWKGIAVKHKARPRTVNGRTVSITGVSGIRYEQAINSTLKGSERKAALGALRQAVDEMEKGRILDFRMYFRGKNRTYHGDDPNMSGRAKEIEQRGFYIKTQKTEGTIPTNIFRLAPEGAHREDAHCAVYPTDLMEIPIKATCPPGGVVLDPFLGTGTSILTALKCKRRAVGIDINQEFVNTAKGRIRQYINAESEC